MSSCRIGGDLLNSTASDNAALGTPAVTSVDISNDIVTINGSNLLTVSRVQLIGGAVNTDLNFNTVSDSKITATAINTFALVFSSAYDLLVSNAGATTTVPITFTLVAGSVTPTILDRSYLPSAGGTLTGPLVINKVSGTSGSIAIQQGTTPASAGSGYGQIYAKSTDNSLRFVPATGSEVVLVPYYAYITAYRTGPFDFHSSSGTGGSQLSNSSYPVINDWNSLPLDSTVSGAVNMLHTTTDQLQVNFPAGQTPTSSTFLITYTITYKQAANRTGGALVSHNEFARLLRSSTSGEIPGSSTQVYMANTADSNETWRISHQVITPLNNGEYVSLQVQTEATDLVNEIGTPATSTATHLQSPAITASVTIVRIGP